MSKKQRLIDSFQEIMLFKSTNDFLKNPTDDNAARYIKDYFNSRSKGCLFNVEFTDRDSLFSKSVHTLMTFLLGVVCRKIVETDIQDKIDKTAKLKKYVIDGFEYPWMLCCLCHDFFSKAEREKETYDNLMDFCEQNEIKYTIYNFKPMKEELRINQMKRIVPTYSRRIVERYFDYRKRKGFLDHGITAGYYIFDRLVKNYFEQRRKTNGDNRFHTVIEGYNLYWDERIIWVYAYCADAIISHNIWHLDKDEKLPKEITLNSSKEKKISIQRNPMSFFLALIDTIEPVKFFKDFEYESILENLFFEIDNNIIAISKTDAKGFDLENWYNYKMKSMPNWLDNIEVEYNESADEIRIVIGDQP